MRKASNISEESSEKCKEKKALVEEFLNGEGSSIKNQIDFMTACIKLDSLLNPEKVTTAFLNQVSSGLLSITNVKGDDFTTVRVSSFVIVERYIHQGIE